jgi:hypothetical protein
LSDQPVDCATHAELVDNADAALEGAVVWALDDALPSTRTVEYCSPNGGCENTAMSVAVNASGGQLTGTWTATVGGMARTGTIDATSCDYDSIVPPAAGETLAAGISIDELSFYQAVKVPVVEGGNLVQTRNAPLIAGRPGVARLFVRPEADWQSREIVARLTMGDTVLEERFTPTGESSETEPASTVNFELLAGSVPGGGDFTVELLETDACASAPGAIAAPRFPEMGTAPLDAQQLAGPLRVTLVPIEYQADGSGRLPDTSAATVERYRDTLMSHYPVEDVQVNVRDAVATTVGLSPFSGGSFAAMLDVCMQTRAADNPPADTYYYCVIQPTSSRGGFCGQGCIGGVAPVPPASRVNSRVGIGVAFNGDGAGIMVHEIGHALGRPHSPSGGASGADPNYPYAQGLIGTWGFDIMSGSLFSPNQRFDFMGYSNPTWVSDFTYSRIFDRLEAVLGLQMFQVEGPERTWQSAVVDSRGNLEWTNAFTTRKHPEGDRVEARVMTTGGEIIPVEAYAIQVADTDHTILRIERVEAGQRVEVEGYAIAELP